MWDLTSLLLSSSIPILVTAIGACSLDFMLFPLVNTSIYQSACTKVSIARKTFAALYKLKGGREDKLNWRLYDITFKRKGSRQ